MFLISNVLANEGAVGKIFLHLTQPLFVLKVISNQPQLSKPAVSYLHGKTALVRRIEVYLVLLSDQNVHILRADYPSVHIRIPRYLSVLTVSLHSLDNFDLMTLKQCLQGSR